ncbi:hypothetical protein [Bradyrhizobium aeschynomenes]|nr:hypothetical protein [Bradyrhizobium aeschynomenes]
MLMKGYAAKHPSDGHALLLVASRLGANRDGRRLLSIDESIPLVVDMDC